MASVPTDASDIRTFRIVIRSLTLIVAVALVCIALMRSVVIINMHRY